MEYDRERFGWGYRLLLSAATVVVVPEEGMWVVVGLDCYHASQGMTREQAERSFLRSYVADVLLHVMTDAALPMRCPEDTWKELIERDGAIVTNVRVAFD